MTDRFLVWSGSQSGAAFFVMHAWGFRMRVRAGAHAWLRAGATCGYSTDGDAQLSEISFEGL